MHTRLAALAAAGVLAVAVAVGVPAVASAQDDRPVIGTTECDAAVDADPKLREIEGKLEFWRKVQDTYPPARVEIERYEFIAKALRQTLPGQLCRLPAVDISKTVITKTSGDQQSAAAGHVFAERLVATVTDPVDHRPIEGARVTFSVAGGSASFAGNRAATVTTTADGRATSPPLIAGNRFGTVTVDANIEGGASQDLSFLLQINPPGPIIPPPTSGQAAAAVKGGGTLSASGQRYSLAFDATTTATGASSGRFAFSGGGADTTAASRTITSVTRTPAGATVSGTAVTAVGKPIGFTVTVVDRPGGHDQVTARLGSRTVTGTLTAGDITTS